MKGLIITIFISIFLTASLLYVWWTQHVKEAIEYDKNTRWQWIHNSQEKILEILGKSVLKEKYCEKEIKYSIVYNGTEIGIIKKKADLTMITLGEVKGEKGTNPKLKLLYEEEEIGYLYLNIIKSFVRGGKN